VINDFTPPWILRFELPTGAHKDGLPQATLRYRVVDRGLSGLGRHRIFIRTEEDARWRRLETRTGGGTQSYVVELEEGQTALLRMSVRDRAGNETVSDVRSVTAPIDEARAGAGTFSGLWETRATESTYMGTEHVSRSPLDELRYSATGAHYCLLFSVGPEYGTAEVTIDDQSYEIDMNADSTDVLHKKCYQYLDSKERSVVVREADGRINVDGFWADDYGKSSGSMSRRETSTGKIVAGRWTRMETPSLRAPSGPGQLNRTSVVRHGTRVGGETMTPRVIDPAVANR
jgi:hypothetical protein